MQNLLDDLKQLLESDERFLADGKLLKNKIIEAALQLDPDLLKLLLSNQTMTKHFFQEVEKVFVFDKIKFQKFVSNKAFLPDSYTAFKNKIGLTVDDQFISEGKEVVLSWPYKDCVLEGGQTNEEEKRNEQFWNEILAPDQIDRLLSPKVFTNFKRITKDGELEVDKLSKDENYLIKGNNLLVLHSLKKVYQGKIKLIYIDPPYNTGSDSFGYNDSFNHSTWLTFMKNRLEVAKELLSSDGSIWINVDDSEAHYLKVLCDEIFGRENFIGNIIWQKKYAPQNDARYFSDNHDHILVYSKCIQNFEINLLPRTSTMDSRYKNPDNDPRGPWASDNLLVKTYAKEYDYPITNPVGREINPPNGSCWRVSPEKYEELLHDNRIWFGKDGKNVPRLKRFLSEVKGGTTPLTIWTYKEVGHNQDARRELFALVNTNEFKTPKPEKLLRRIIEIGTIPGDYVMDFFGGSGTTAAVALKMKRKFFLIEQMEYCETVTKTRLTQVINGEQGGISNEVSWKGGGDFIFLDLFSINNKFLFEINLSKDQLENSQIYERIIKSKNLTYKYLSDLFLKNEFYNLFTRYKLTIFTVIRNRRH